MPPSPDCAAWPYATGATGKLIQSGEDVNTSIKDDGIRTSSEVNGSKGCLKLVLGLMATPGRLVVDMSEVLRNSSDKTSTA